MKKRIDKCGICHKKYGVVLESRQDGVHHYCKRCHAVHILTHSKYYINNYGLNSTLDMLGVKAGCEKEDGCKK